MQIVSENNVAWRAGADIVSGLIGTRSLSVNMEVTDGGGTMVVVEGHSTGRELTIMIGIDGVPPDECVGATNFVLCPPGELSSTGCVESTEGLSALLEWVKGEPLSPKGLVFSRRSASAP